LLAVARKHHYHGVFSGAVDIWLLALRGEGLIERLGRARNLEAVGMEQRLEEEKQRDPDEDAITSSVTGGGDAGLHFQVEQQRSSPAQGSSSVHVVARVDDARITL
jgi:hypothetical protein